MNHEPLRVALTSIVTTLALIFILNLVLRKLAWIGRTSSVLTSALAGGMFSILTLLAATQLWEFLDPPATPTWLTNVEYNQHYSLHVTAECTTVVIGVVAGLIAGLFATKSGSARVEG
ncbi:MAG: hypothetical protein ACE361_03115 [Aureliella sp.]